jgi:nucleoside-diphosphate-sugar epimerase
MSAGTALVTGASGFVGHQLTRLLRAKGWRVRGALRRSGAFTELDEIAAVGEIGPDTEWDAALEGVDVVFHLAGRVHMRSAGIATDEASFKRVNADGTRALARAAAGAGVRRIVYVSSIKVNGEATPHGPFRASDEPGPRDAYGRSKLAAERELARVSAETGLEVAVVRPPLVYGPGVTANFLRLCAWVDHGRPLPLGSVRNRRSLIYVGNLCELLMVCAWHPAAASATFLASDGQDVSTPELVRRIAHALGRRPRLMPVPEPLLRTAARLTGTASTLASLCDSLWIDLEPTTRQLNWTPPHSLEDGLIHTARWWRQHDSATFLGRHAL